MAGNVFLIPENLEFSAIWLQVTSTCLSGIVYIFSKIQERHVKQQDRCRIFEILQSNPKNYLFIKNRANEKNILRAMYLEKLMFKSNTINILLDQPLKISTMYILPAVFSFGEDLTMLGQNIAWSKSML